MLWILASGLILGAGVLMLRALVWPPAPDLVAEIEQWRRGREIASERAGTETPPTLLGRITRWVAETLTTHRPSVLATLNPDLAITGRDLQGWLSRVILIAAGFAIGPTIAMGLRRLGDSGVSLQWGPVIGLGLAVFAVVFSVKDLRREAAQRRAEFIHRLSSYLDMVAFNLAAGRGHAEALPAAAQIGQGWVFGEIRHAIDLAPAKGISAWDALGQLGERYRIPDLIGLRASLSLAQDEGSRVKASLVARAKTMRANRLAAALERANNATESMRHLTMIAAALAAVYIVMPYILALRGAVN